MDDWDLLRVYAHRGNAVPRARLLDFINALGIDPDLHRLFVKN